MKTQIIERKLAVLEVIKSEKNVLFGSFNGNALNKTEKEQAWKRVLEKAQALGLAGQTRTWQFMRDSLFGTWKSRALAKGDNSRKTGTGGGVESKIDEIDKTIFHILDKESPVLDGLNVIESDGVFSSNFLEDEDNNVGNHQIKDKGKKEIKRKSRSETNNNEEKKIKKSNEGLLYEIKKLKKEWIEVEMYKSKLEILKLERELGIGSSKFTEELVSKSKSTTEKKKTVNICRVLDLKMC